MSEIFISFQSDHRGTAGSIAALLERQGYTAWWSGMLLAGVAYEREIFKRLNASACVIVIWSAKSIESEWVRGEAEFARERNRLVPIKIDDVRLWPPYSTIHTVDFRNWNGGSDCSEWLELTNSISQFASPGSAQENQKISRLGHMVHKLKAKDSTGRWAYYFILVEPSRASAFLTAIAGHGMIDMEDYGKVIASCYGEEPNAETKAFLKEKYGFVV